MARRREGDSAYLWLSELDLPAKWQKWLDNLHIRHQTYIERALSAQENKI